MRCRTIALGLALGLAACASVATPIAPPLDRTVPRLLPPPPLVDLDAPDAIYRTAFALQLQPSWAQFLDDCRLRLPATHALNSMALSASADIAIDAGGRIVDIRLASSGNADFDRAVRQVIGDAEPLPRPPRALWSDDDLVHVRWLFARDRRQAGPATATVEHVQLPVGSTVHRFVTQGELARAAQRIRREPASSARDAATHELMVAALGEGLRSTDATVRRAAVDAIGRAAVRELAAPVREMLTTTSDFELRVAALETVARLGDRAAVPAIVDQLRSDLVDDRRLAIVETQTLVTLGAGAEAAALVRDELERRATPNLVALHALSAVSIPELGARVTGWLGTGDARTRAAACEALASAPASARWSGIARGLADRDATVRASCLDAARAAAPLPADAPRLLRRVTALVRDRDATVRARAVGALAALGIGQLPDLGDDRAAEVRAAYARALAVARPDDAEARLRALLDDRDADVRADAWAAWLSLPLTAATNGVRAPLASRAANDPAPQVRVAAIGALDDDALLARLATADDAADVRTAATVALVARRGRTSSSDVLLERLAAAAPGSAERVRAARAWLLAR